MRTQEEAASSGMFARWPKVFSAECSGWTEEREREQKYPEEETWVTEKI